MAARYALYFTPAPRTPLWRFGCDWLGYDAADGQTIAPTGLADLDAEIQSRVTETPRRYGFHATLKAPFGLAEGVAERDLHAAVKRFARRRRRFSLPPLQLAELERFLALQPTSQNSRLTDLADECVRAFEPFRAPLSDAERERRSAAGLTPRQRELLNAWGYPYVFEAFRFHITLTGPLPRAERARVRAALEPVLATICAAPLDVDAVCLCRESDSAAPWRILSRHAFDSASLP